MKRILVEFAVQLIVLVVLFVVIGLGAAFLGATTGASASAIAADFHMEIADRLGLVCPKGQTLSVRHDRVVTGVDSHGRPYAGNANDAYCTSTAEGTSHQLTDQEYLNARVTSLGVAMVGYTLLCFVPLFLPLEIVALIVIHKAVGGIMKPAPASQSVIST
jgi:hypothetical protein